MLMLMVELLVECPTVRCFHGVAAKNCMSALISSPSSEVRGVPVTLHLYTCTHKQPYVL